MVKGTLKPVGMSAGDYMKKYPPIPKELRVKKRSYRGK